MPHSTIEIHFSNPYLALYGHPSTSAGKALKGVVVVRFKRPAKVKSLILKLEGESDINWIYSTALLNSKCRFRDKLIDQTLTILEPSEEMHSMPAGESKFPFEFALDGNIMETIKTQVVRCDYSLTAVAERPHFQPRLSVKKPVLVKRFFQHNDDPIVAYDTIPNVLSIEFFAQKKVYGIGDDIPIQIRCLPLGGADRVCLRINSAIKEITTFKKPKSHKTNVEKKWHRVVFEKEFSDSTEREVVMPIQSNDIQFDCDNVFMETKHEIVLRIEAKHQGQTLTHFIKIPIIILSDTVDRIFEALPPYYTLEDLPGVPPPSYSQINIALVV
ncbi:hypothetical protein K493DRAFT_387629 [Basidiobolus meristosporus CBS 931.73]|uniref:Arrestin-like N-terminal domain-containing protein n=1 Tax=Basidiobolus meristosporus CBS 931.73 TaxID=1314790 RepID=A0A1Y1XF14_9FUNG|nr:hypothetical protein K493DRAFT_387629 [Basidiobolus meristosporus CBS 931.73]|eukprot:ORX83954.1 hypothetical protein K493DRAFT_387629 [Basidiobolus meristosporus CBS 931.73]